MLLGQILKSVGKNYQKIFVRGISFDSRKTKKQDIFFAIEGSKANGKKYIKEAIKNGATTIISNLNFLGKKEGVLYVKNKNPRKLLSETVSKIYKLKPQNLIAVTGTNGKSSIADFYCQILKLNNKKFASIGTLGIKTCYNNLRTNNTTLDPILLSEHLEKMRRKKIKNIILEASSHGLKQHRLDGIKFKIGIFTN